MCTKLWAPALLISLMCLPASAQTAADLFNPGMLHEIRISIHPMDWQNLKTHFDENTHYPADFHWIYEGRDIEAQQVSVRSRGLGSRNGIKPGLTVDFGRFADRTFLGLKSVVLRNNAQDASMIRERVAMAFMNLLEIPAPREAHARLFINGAYAGLYSLVETVDESFLQRVFGQKNGYLYNYEWAFSWFFDYLGVDPAKYSPVLFKPETHVIDPAPWPLEWMFRAIHDSADSWFEGEVSRYIDLSAFMRYIAVENFLAEQDGLLGDWGVNNFYFYRFENSEQSQFIPWDRSQSFHSLQSPIFRNINTNALAARSFAIPELRAVYLQTMQRSAELAGGSGGWLENEILNEYAQIHEAALEDPLKQCYPPRGQSLASCSNEQFEAEIAFLMQFANVRSADVIQQLKAVF